MSELHPDNEQTRKLAKTIKLGGKTIFEWREDCRIFLEDKLSAEKKIVQDTDELNKTIFELENTLLDLKLDNTQLKSKKT